jgi:Lon protease-like protein
MKRPHSPADLPRIVPVFPLTGALLLPFGQRPLNIFEPRYVAMIDHVLRGDRLIGLIQPQDTTEESPPGHAPLQKVGTVGRISRFDEVAEGRYFIVLDGVCRFEVVTEMAETTPFRQFAIDPSRFASDFEHGLGGDAVNRDRFLKMMKDYAEFANIELDWDEIKKTDTADLVNFCCMVSPYGAAEKQVLLEAGSLLDRAETLIAMAELEMARSGSGASPLQ